MSLNVLTLLVEWAFWRLVYSKYKKTHTHTYTNAGTHRFSGVLLQGRAWPSGHAWTHYFSLTWPNQVTSHNRVWRTVGPVSSLLLCHASNGGFCHAGRPVLPLVTAINLFLCSYVPSFKKKKNLVRQQTPHFFKIYSSCVEVSTGTVNSSVVSSRHQQAFSTSFQPVMNTAVLLKVRFEST